MTEYGEELDQLFPSLLRKHQLMQSADRWKLLSALRFFSKGPRGLPLSHFQALSEGYLGIYDPRWDMEQVLIAYRRLKEGLMAEKPDLPKVPSTHRYEMFLNDCAENFERLRKQHPKEEILRVMESIEVVLELLQEAVRHEVRYRELILSKLPEGMKPEGDELNLEELPEGMPEWGRGSHHLLSQDEQERIRQEEAAPFWEASTSTVFLAALQASVHHLGIRCENSEQFNSWGSELEYVESTQTLEAEKEAIKTLTNFSQRIAKRRMNHHLIMNDMRQFHAFGHTAGGNTFALRRSGQLSEENLAACFDLVKRTSSASYKASSRGWNPDDKMKEMRDPEMWYILVKNNAARDEDGELAPETVQGFLSFMVTFDDPPHDDEHVGYIYEIHLEKELRGSGLGSWLIMHAERIIRGLGIDKMMLTVFTCNDRAVRLYEHLGYTIDRCSPPPRKTRHGTFKPTYIIMSKALGVDPDWPKALDAYAFEPEDFEHYSNTYSYSILNLQRVLLANERADLL